MKRNNNISDLKLGFMERRLYNQFYSIVEKVLKSSYQIYKLADRSYTYEQFAEHVSKKLKGD